MQCLVCEKIKEGKALVVYEDRQIVAVHPSKPAAAGHIKVMPRQHYTKLDEMPLELLKKALSISNTVSSIIYDLKKAQGTNIIINENDTHASIDVIPRKEGDNMNFSWKPMQLSNEEMGSVYSKVRDACFAIGKSVDASKKSFSSPANSEQFEEGMQPGSGRPVNAKHLWNAKSQGEVADKKNDDDKIQDENYMHKNLTKIP